jgi:hypothetical protein
MREQVANYRPQKIKSDLFITKDNKEKKRKMRTRLYWLQQSFGPMHTSIIPFHITGQYVPNVHMDAYGAYSHRKIIENLRGKNVWRRPAGFIF